MLAGAQETTWGPGRDRYAGWPALNNDSHFPVVRDENEDEEIISGRWKICGVDGHGRSTRQKVIQPYGNILSIQQNLILNKA